MTTRPANPREKPRHGSPRVLFPFKSSLRNHRSSLSIVLSTFLKFWTPTEIVYLLEWKNLQFDLCVLVRNWTRRRNNLVKTRWFPEYLANKKIRKEWRTAIIRINWSDKVSRSLTRNSNERRSDVPKRGFILSPTSCEAFSCCVNFIWKHLSPSSFCFQFEYFDWGREARLLETNRSLKCWGCFALKTRVARRLRWESRAGW